MLFTLLLVFILSSWVNAQGNGAVRFYRVGRTSHLFDSGIVQIYYVDLWGNVCYDSDWGTVEADVVCRQLGWSGSSATAPVFSGSFGYDDSPTALGHVSCANNSLSVLLQCSSTIIYDSFCGNNYDVTVSCYTTRLWDSLGYPGMVRLIDGSYSTDGRVEVYCSGEWGTVCDDAISYIEAHTFCRQLGYSEAIKYDHLILPGNASQPIWLDDVVCGLEPQDCIANCKSCPSDRYQHNCYHGEDLTLSCTYKSDTGGSNIDTCKGISSDSSESEISQSLVIGLIVGGFVLLLILSVVVFVCLILMCGVKRDRNTEQQNTKGEKEEPIMGKVSPEVIQMEGSPKMYRKAQKDNHYLIAQQQNIAAAYNPALTQENGAVHFVTTPPAYMGNPTFKNYL